ncbi:glycoside hydrolase family 38 protein [Atractiella rhizophila]|nr:glycoside hydrolase family 38 protein [Atractiella rhizophila]
MSQQNFAAPMSGPAPYPELNFTPNAPIFKGTTNGRLDQFDSGSSGDTNVLAVLFEDRTDDEKHVQLEVWSAPGRTKPTFSEAVRQNFKPAKKGIMLGPSWTQHWFRVILNIPKEWKDKERIQFEFDPSGEAMIFDAEGLPLQGITGGFGGDRRVEFIIPKEARGFPYKIYIEASCNAMFGNGDGSHGPPDDNRYFRLNSADLVVPRMQAWHLLWDFRILRDISRTLPLDNSSLGNVAFLTANKILNEFDASDLSTIAKCRKIAETVFGEGWAEKGEKVYEEGLREKDIGHEQVWGIGNCHIDTAWLWPYSATQQKTARSWSTQCDLIERYPEFTFVASQAQQFKWLEQQYPKLFQVIKTKVDEGKFQPIGGTWVEMDTNMPSGEALCRQFAYGQRYFKSRFGEYCDVFWLPDTFGYSSQLPQLARNAGMKYFFTQKLSWNQYNSFPRTTFNWIGLDGTQVITHMTPVNTYTAQAYVGDVRNATYRHKNLGTEDKGLLAYGNGDGGGGPLAPMIEGLRRIRAAANERGELPKVKMGSSVGDFYRAIEKDSNGGRDLTTWHGELYFELHRGTYTSHGSIKKGNRKSEVLLREIEFAATFASLAPHAREDRQYVFPKDDVDELWENTLLQQFHDVLPGSGIGMIYEDAEKYYAHIRNKGNALLEKALQVYLPGTVPITSPSINENYEIVAVNTLCHPRREIVRLPNSQVYSATGSFQTSRNQEFCYALVEDRDGTGVATIQNADALLKQGHVFAQRRGDVVVMGNAFLWLEVSPQGRITRLADLGQSRELIADGQTAGFVIFDDHPLNWDAWDVDFFHLQTKKNVDAHSVEIVETGPLRATLLAKYRIGKDTEMRAYISLDAVPHAYGADALTMIRIDVEVDWHERHKFLKWEIPLNINSDIARYETQFGVLSRPTHRNTTWDAAKFEVCGHRFADLSEYGYGVALLNDCKYGYACEGNVLRISLLRAATAPDAEQDQHYHEFSLGVLPHRGSFDHSQVPLAGMIFNTPLHLRKVASSSINTLTARKSPVHIVGGSNVFIDTIKRGDDDDFSGDEYSAVPRTVVLRIYEAYGGHASVDLQIDLGVKKATICDILERDQGEVLVKPVGSGSVIPLQFRAFQVISVKLYLDEEVDFIELASNSSVSGESWTPVQE